VVKLAASGITRYKVALIFAPAATAPIFLNAN